MQIGIDEPEPEDSLSHILLGDPVTPNMKHSNLGSESSSALIKQKLNFKHKILINNILCAGVLNLGLAVLIALASISVKWYNMQSTDLDENITLGLIFQLENNNIILIDESGTLLVGIITLALLWCGILQQVMFSWFVVRLLLRCSVTSIEAGHKPVRFKTLSKTIFYTHITALVYWLTLTIIMQRGHDLFVGDQHPTYSFYVCLGSSLGFLVVFQYFRLVKEKLRQNIVMGQLIQEH